MMAAYAPRRCRMIRIIIPPPGRTLLLAREVFDQISELAAGQEPPEIVGHGRLPSTRLPDRRLRDRLFPPVGTLEDELRVALAHDAARLDGIVVEQQRRSLIARRDRLAREEQRLEEVLAGLPASDSRQGRPRRPALLADPVALVAARMDPHPEELAAAAGVAAFQALAPGRQRVVLLPGAFE